MRVRKVVRLAQDFLNYCARNSEWDAEDRPPLMNFLESLQSDDKIGPIFGVDSAWYFISSRLSEPDFRHRAPYTTDEADRFVTDLEEHLKINLGEHYILVPLRGARMKRRRVSFGDFHLLRGSRGEIRKMLVKMGAISPENAASMMEHTVMSRSGGFFDYPLLVIHTRHQTERIRWLSRYYAYYSIALMQALYWAQVEGPEEFRDGPGLWSVAQQPRECNHIAVYSPDSWRIHHSPMNFGLRCDFGLDFMAGKGNQGRFSAVFRTVLDSPRQDLLLEKFRLGLRFFSKALEAESRRDPYEGLGLPLLYLTTAAEAVVLSGHNGSNRIKLSAILPRVSRIRDVSLREAVAVVDRCYGLRSQFVHEGGDIHDDWQQDEETGKRVAGQNLTAAILYARMVASLLVSAPDLVRRKSLATSDDSLAGAWARYIESLWQNVLSGAKTEGI